MDGSISTGSYKSSSLDALRAESLRFDSPRGDARGDSLRADGSSGLSSSSVHGNLFEQILSLPAPISVDRADDSGEAYSSDPLDDYVEPSSESQSASEQSNSEAEDEPRDSDDSVSSAVTTDAQVNHPAELLPVVAEVKPDAPAEDAASASSETEIVAGNVELKAGEAVTPDANENQNISTSIGETVADATSDEVATESNQAALQNPTQDVVSEAPQETATKAEQAPIESNVQGKDDAAELHGLQSDQEITEDPTHQALEEQIASQAAESQPRERKHSDTDREQGKWFEKDASNQVEPTTSAEPYSEELKPIQAEQGQTRENPLPSPESISTATLDESTLNLEPSFASTTTTVSNMLPESALFATTATTDGDIANIAASPSGGKVERNIAREASKTTQAEQGGQPDELTQQERVRLVQRVARSFARLGPTGGQINLRLHPPQLGSLNVQVRLEGRSMTAKLTTETSAARDAILESLPVLRGRLAEQGYEVSQFQVEVADNNADANFGQSNDQAARDPRRDSGTSQVDYRRLALGRSTATSSGQASPNPTLVWQTTAGIDVHA